jgi:ubiquinone/menaquinone biosynthesis C-methylase UbiE
MKYTNTRRNWRMGMENRTWETTEKNKYNDAYLNQYHPKNVLDGWYDKYCENIEKAIKQPIRVLDIGCGPGYTRAIGLKYNIDVIGLDIASALVPCWSHYKIPAVVAASSAIPFKNNSFDVVTVWDVMEHIPEEGILETLREIVRVGKNKTAVSFLICLTEELIKFEGKQFHVTIKPIEWWVDKIRSVGMTAPDGYTLDMTGTHLMSQTLTHKE